MQEAARHCLSLRLSGPCLNRQIFRHFRPAVLPRHSCFELPSNLQGYAVVSKRCNDLQSDRTSIRMRKPRDIESRETQRIDPATEHSLGGTTAWLAANGRRSIEISLPRGRSRGWRQQRVESTPSFAGAGAKDLQAIDHANVIDCGYLQASACESCDLIGRIGLPAGARLRGPRRAHRRECIPDRAQLDDVE